MADVAAKKQRVPKPPSARITKKLDVFVSKTKDGKGWAVVDEERDGAQQLQVADIPFLQEWGVQTQDSELIVATLAACQLALMKTTTKNEAGEASSTIARPDKVLKKTTSGLVSGLLGCMRADELLHELVAFYRIMAKADRNSIAAASLAVFIHNSVGKADRNVLNAAVDYLGATSAIEEDVKHIVMPPTTDVDGEPSTTLSLVDLCNMFTSAVARSAPVEAMKAVYLLRMHTSKDVKNREEYHLPLVRADEEEATFILEADKGERLPASGDTVFRTTLRQWCNVVLEMFPCKPKRKDGEDKTLPSPRQLVKRNIACFFNIIPACGGNSMIAISALCVFLCRHHSWPSLEPPDEEDYTDKAFVAAVTEFNEKVAVATKNDLKGYVFPTDAFTSQTSIGRLEGRTAQQDLVALAKALGESEREAATVEDSIVASYADVYASGGLTPAEVVQKHLLSYGLAGSKKLRQRALKEGGGVSPLPKGGERKAKSKSVAKLITLDPLPVITLAEGLNVERLYRWTPPRPRGNRVDWFVMQLEDVKSKTTSYWGVGVPTTESATFSFQTNLDATKAVFDCTSMDIKEVEYDSEEPPIALFKLPFTSEPPLESISNFVGDDAEFVDFEKWEAGRMRELQDVYGDMAWNDKRCQALLRLLALRSLANVNNNNFATIYYDSEADTFMSLDLPATNRQSPWDETTPWTGVLFRGTRRPSVKFLSEQLYPHLQHVVELLKSDKCKTAVDDSLFDFAINGHVRAHGRLQEMAAALEASVKNWDPTAKPQLKKKAAAKKPAKKKDAKKRKVAFADEEEEEEEGDLNMEDEEAADASSSDDEDDGAIE